MSLIDNFNNFVANQKKQYNEQLTKPTQPEKPKISSVSNEVIRYSDGGSYSPTGAIKVNISSSPKKVNLVPPFQNPFKQNTPKIESVSNGVIRYDDGGRFAPEGVSVVPSIKAQSIKDKSLAIKDKFLDSAKISPLFPASPTLSSIIPTETEKKETIKFNNEVLRPMLSNAISATDKQISKILESTETPGYMDRLKTDFKSTIADPKKLATKLLTANPLAGLYTSKMAIPNDDLRRLYDQKARLENIAEGKEVGFSKTLYDNRGQFMPFITDISDVANAAHLESARKKMESKEDLNIWESMAFNDHLIMAMEERTRGGDIALAFGHSAKFMAEFGLARTALKAGAEKVIPAMLKNPSTRSAARHLKDVFASNRLGLVEGTLTEKIKQYVRLEPLRALAAIPLRPSYYSGLFKRMVLPELSFVEENGEYFARLNKNDTEFKEALFKQTAVDFVELISEGTGEYMAVPKGLTIFGKKVLNRVSPEIAKKGYDNLKKAVLAYWVKNQGIDSALQSLKRRVRWDGVARQVAEEELAEPFVSLIEGEKYHHPLSAEGRDRLWTTLGVILLTAGALELPRAKDTIIKAVEEIRQDTTGGVRLYEDSDSFQSDREVVREQIKIEAELKGVDADTIIKEAMKEVDAKETGSIKDLSLAFEKATQLLGVEKTGVEKTTETPKQILPFTEFSKSRGELVDKYEAEVWTEMDLSEAGQRQFTEEGVTGYPSTFPKWIPSDLRSKKLFDNVLDKITKDQIPTTKRQLELFQAMQSEVMRRISAEAQLALAEYVEKKSAEAEIGKESETKQKALLKEGLIESKKHTKAIEKKEKQEQAKAKKLEIKKQTQLRKALERELSQVFTTLRAKRPKSKWGAEAHEYLKKLLFYSRMSPVAMEQEIDRDTKKYQKLPKHLEIKHKLMRHFGNIKEANVQQLTNMLDIVDRIKSEGIETRYLHESDIDREVSEVADIVRETLFPGKTVAEINEILNLQERGLLKAEINPVLAKFLRHTDSWLLSYRGMLIQGMDAFNKDSRHLIHDKLDFTKEYGIADEVMDKINNKMVTLMDKVFSDGKADTYAQKYINMVARNKQFHKDHKKQYKLSIGTRKFNKAQIRYIYAVSFQTGYQNIVLDQFGKESFVLKNGIVDNIIDADGNNILTDKDKAFVKGTFDIYREIYPEYNAAYRKINGANLGFYDKYVPVKTNLLKVNEDMFGVPSTPKATMATSSQYQRAKNKKDYHINVESDIKIFFEYSMTTSNYIGKAEKWNIATKTFNNREVLLALQAKWGKEIANQYVRNLQQHLKYEARTSKDETHLAFKSVDWMSSNYVQAVLMLKAKNMWNQMTSGIIAVEHVPMHLAPKYLGKTLVNLLGAHKHYSEISYAYKHRGMSAKEAELNKVINSPDYKTALGLPSLSNITMLNIKYGDRIGYLIAGYSNYLYHVDVLKKYNPSWSEQKIQEEAVLISERAATSAQQSPRKQDKSLWQKSNITFLRVMLKFQSTPLQFQSKVHQYALALAMGKGNAMQNIKNIILFHSVLPMIYNFILYGGTGDEDWLKKLRNAAIFGNLSVIPLYGGIIVDIIKIFGGEKVYEPGTILGKLQKSAQGVAKAIKQMHEGKILNETEKYYFRKDLLDIGMFLAPLNANLFLDFQEGINRIKAGDKSGWKLLSGWSRYVVDGGGFSNSNKPKFYTPSSSSFGTSGLPQIPSSSLSGGLPEIPSSSLSGGLPQMP